MALCRRSPQCGQSGTGKSLPFVRPQMPTCAWACAACGAANGPSAEQCASCACPAKFTYAQLEHFRTEHLKHGGLVSPAAPGQVQPEDLSAVEVLLAPVTFVLFGALPADFLSSFQTERYGWLLVLAGPGLFIVSYAVLGSVQLFSGPDASTHVALWSFAVAVVGFLGVALWLAVRVARGRLASR